MASDSQHPGSTGFDVADRFSRLEERLDAVERALSALSPLTATGIGEREVAAAPPPPPLPGATPLGSAASGVRLSSPPPSPAGTGTYAPPPARPTNVPMITPEMALRWAGAVLVFFAAVFLVSTAISRGWIGPEVRLGLATIGGAALVATGVHLDRRWGAERRPWSLALANTGVVVLGACAGAAHGWLNLVGVGTAAALAVVVSAVGLALAEWFRHESLAISGLAVALFVPGAIDAYAEFGDIATGAWLLILVVVTMALAARHGWTIPRLLGLVVIGPSMVLLSQEFSDVSVPVAIVVQAMIVAAGLLWWLAPWLKPAEQTLRLVDHRLVFAVPGMIWLSSTGLWAVTDRGRALVAVIVAAGFGAVTGSIALGRLAVGSLGRPTPQLLFGHLVGVSSLLSVALALWVDGPALLSALTVQALGTTALAARSDDDLLNVNAAALGAVTGVWTALGLLDGMENGLDTADAVAYVLVVAATAVGAWLIRHRSRPIAGLVAIASWIGLLAWVMAVLRPLAQGQMMVSIIWAMLGAAPVLVGVDAIPRLNRVFETTGDGWRNRFKSLGLATLGATVVKLVTIDLAEVDTIWRALLFAVVGLGLLRLGYRIDLLAESGEPADHQDR